MKATIYQDPITKQDKEGVAELLEEVLPDAGDGLSLWIVTFDGEMEVQRTVDASDIEEEE
jgi:hypothetical protein